MSNRKQQPTFEGCFSYKGLRATGSEETTIPNLVASCLHMTFPYIGANVCIIAVIDLIGCANLEVIDSSCDQARVITSQGNLLQHLVARRVQHQQSRHVGEHQDILTQKRESATQDAPAQDYLLTLHQDLLLHKLIGSPAACDRSPLKTILCDRQVAALRSERAGIGRLGD